jgi:hypothetical protein
MYSVQMAFLVGVLLRVGLCPVKPSRAWLRDRRYHYLAVTHSAGGGWSLNSAIPTDLIGTRVYAFHPLYTVPASTFEQGRVVQLLHGAPGVSAPLSI